MLKAKKFVMEKGYYEILEVSPHATTVDIQRSFERLCDEHVNINSDVPEVRRKSAEILFALTKGYEILTDPFQRLSYDERRFPAKQPFNNEVETIFKEGIRHFRNNDMDAAIRFLKESVYLMPHKVIYRVNLAIAYHEKGWREYAEKELRMALKLDPNNDFAKEVVAKVLFRVSDKKNVGFFAHKVNRQLAAAVTAAVILVGGLAFGVPKVMAYNKTRTANTELDKQKASEMKAALPTDLKQALGKKNKKKARANVTINRLADEFAPEGQVYSYTNLKAVKKTYYPDQNLVVIDYDNGNMMTYKPQDLMGWKVDQETKQPVVITKANEVIPVPTNLPVTMANGKSLMPGDAGFPAAVFPEYGSSAQAPKAEVAQAPVAEPVMEAPAAEAPAGNLPPVGLPPVGGNP